MSDLMLKKAAIDTKYRIGQRRLRYAQEVQAVRESVEGQGVRADPPHPSDQTTYRRPFKACTTGGWRILIGEASFEYIKKETGFDLHAYLVGMAKKHDIKRTPTTPLIEESGDTD